MNSRARYARVCGPTATAVFASGAAIGAAAHRFAQMLLRGTSIYSGGASEPVFAARSAAYWDEGGTREAIPAPRSACGVTRRTDSSISTRGPSRPGSLLSCSACSLNATLIAACARRAAQRHPS